MIYLMRISEVSMKKIILVLSVIFSLNANAVQTNNWYFELHEDAKLFYFVGVLDVINYQNNYINEKPLYCLKKGVTNGQVYLMFNKHLNDNPIILNEKVNVTMLKLLANSFPCDA